MKNTAAIYVRLSQQGETEESIARQIELGTAYAKQRQWDPLLYVEPKGYRSGYYEHKRPAWQQLKKDLAVREDVIAVVVADFARASRKVEHFFAFVEFLQLRGIQFVSLKEQVDASTAAGRALLGMIAVFNQFYRDDVSERKKRQFKFRDPAIYAPNRAPLGLKRTGKYPALHWETTDEFKYVVEMLELYADGRAAEDVAKQMRARGHTWQALRNSTAPTDITVRNVVNKVERYAAFLDPALLFRVQSERERRGGRRANSNNVKHPLPVLRQLVRCADCGARFSTRWKLTRAGSDWSYYEHPPTDCQFAKRVIKSQNLDARFWQEFLWLDQLTDADLDYIAARIGERAGAKPDGCDDDASLRRDKLVTRLQGYEQMRADGDIPRERFLQLKAELEREIFEIDSVRLTTQAQVRMANVSAQTVRLYLGDLRTAFREQSVADWQKTNLLLQTVLARVLVRNKEFVTIEYRAGWEGLLTGHASLEK